FVRHLKHIGDIIGLAEGVKAFSTLSLVILSHGAYFLADTYVSSNPSAEEIAEMAMLTARHVNRFGITPRIALLSHSNFGSSDTESARKMRRAAEMLRETAPDLEVDGEMDGETALNVAYRERQFPHSFLKGQANVLIFPDLDAANISYQLIKVFADALPVGPILLGAARPAHILAPSVTARGVVNMTALSVVDAQQAAAGK
ncbi:MAG: NADP-dependent malic enzyme, partial [Alphaproteobacteria bacterium]